MIAAFNAAESAVDVHRLPHNELTAQALRDRVLVSPLDGHLLMAAARSQARQQAFHLLADALDMAEDEAFWEGITVVELLSAPTHMGEATGRRLAAHLKLPPDASVAALDACERGRLVEGLREYAPSLPAEASGRPVKRKLPDDGAGAADDILRRWVDPLGAATDPVRVAAWDAAQRPGWPRDAVPAVAVLAEFTHRTVMPLIVPGFDRILDAGLGHDDLIAALRAEEREHRANWNNDGSESDEVALTCAWVLGRDVIVLQSLRKARTQLAMASDDRRGKTPLALAREAARRCAEILVWADADPVELLAPLPGGDGQSSSGSSHRRRPVRRR